MKTGFRDFSMTKNLLVTGDNELDEVINNRHEKCKNTVDYYKAKEEALDALKKIESLLPKEQKELEDIDLEELFFLVECICYKTAYLDGMNDLMTAMTLNKLDVTKVEYYDLGKGA